MGHNLGGVAVLFNPMGFDWSDPDVVKGNAILMAGAALSAGGSLYPSELFKLAGVDMNQAEPINKAFGILAGRVQRDGA